MKIDCSKCGGDGDLECLHCGSSVECSQCGGDGYLVECISTVPLPKNSKHKEALEAMQADAGKCQADHERLVCLNPQSKESYDRQLAAALKEIDQAAETLLNS